MTRVIAESALSIWTVLGCVAEIAAKITEVAKTILPAWASDPVGLSLVKLGPSPGF